MPSELDDMRLDDTGFAYLNILGRDKWYAWTPVFTNLTVVGATSYIARQRTVGHLCQAQVKMSAATSIASTAGSTYLALPLNAMGLTGFCVMTNDTAKTAVGLGHIDVTNSRMYLPSQVASGNIFHLFMEFEV